MKIGVINYEALTKNFKCYHDSKNKLESLQKEYVAKMETYKEQMETLYKTSTSLLLDETTQAANQKKFMELQKEASKMQSEFAKSLNEKQQKEMEYCYDELSKIVATYSKGNKIDLVLSNTSIVYSANNLDITENILTEFKNLDLYVDEVVEKELV